MPIHHMLYRCPRCGHDPLGGRKGRAKCSSCGTGFQQGRGSLILVHPPQGPVEKASATERISWRGEGLIRLEGKSLTFTPDGKAAGRRDGVDSDAGGEGFSCLLGDIRGVQISSGAVQVTLERGQLHQFEFVDDSAKRWEDLLCLALRRFYSEKGRSVIEFKPRVVTEWLPIGSDR